MKDLIGPGLHETSVIAEEYPLLESFAKGLAPEFDRHSRRQGNIILQLISKDVAGVALGSSLCLQRHGNRMFACFARVVSTSLSSNRRTVQISCATCADYPRHSRLHVVVQTSRKIGRFVGCSQAQWTDRLGRRQWKENIGYHRRSLSETAMYRMKCCFGDHLKNRLIENQKTETRLRSNILNKFTHLGLPQFEWS